MVEMRFEGLHLEERDNEQINVVLLKEIEGDRTLSLDIGPMEAMAISIAMQKERLPRPLTHDLIIFCLRALQAQFLQSVIVDYRDGMFFSLIEIGQGQKRIRIDSRPSDAIALALRTVRPICTTETLLEKMQEIHTCNIGETLPLKTPDSAAEMVRRTSAKHMLDMMNANQNQRMDLSDAKENDDQLLELLRSLEPATRQKM